jgi:hypothetical protein
MRCLRGGGAALAVSLLLVTAGAVAAATNGVPPELIEKATATGAIRVLVQLKVDATDAASIETVKQAVLGEVSGTRYRIARQLPGLPAIAIEASADTLRALASSPRVERVTEDLPRRPQR